MAPDAKLAALRELMKAAPDGPLQAYIVPSEDAHQSEYLAERDKRREFISGFDGSAGVAVITMDDARLWTDGRYFLQAEKQLGEEWKLMRGGEDVPLEKWLAQTLPSGSRVGVDGWCVSLDTSRVWDAGFAKSRLKLVPYPDNLVDKLWTDRPAAGVGPVIVHPLKFAGVGVGDKLKQVRARLVEERAAGLLVTALDEVAWLFNIRGCDVDYNPVVHAFGLVTASEAKLFIDDRKLDKEVRAHLAGEKVSVHPYDSISEHIKAFFTADGSEAATPAAAADEDGDKAGAAASKGAKGKKAARGGKGQKATAEPPAGEPAPAAAAAAEAPLLTKRVLWVNPASCNLVLGSLIPEGCSLQITSPVMLAKALKNPVELQGMRACHIRDGAALVRYFAWLDEQMQAKGAAGYFGSATDASNAKTKKAAAGGSRKRKKAEPSDLTEWTAAAKLEEFRSEGENFVGLSFPTISSTGANAAVIHYSPTANTALPLDPERIYLCDSGAQYRDGTTDITRTVHFGSPSAYEQACFSRVLKGHIALDRMVFPKGTTGHVLDILCRVPLWRVGLDYMHGTGHGVGAFLNVHEGPQSISFRPTSSKVAMQASMTISNEPGYYEQGAFGIRIENVLVVKETQLANNFNKAGWMGFEHIAFAPMQVKLMDLSLLTKKEMDWVDDYHNECRTLLMPYMKTAAERDWLTRATEPISRPEINLDVE
eukprot:jgi/Mesvir1/8247/Mv12523-RA.1